MNKRYIEFGTFLGMLLIIILAVVLYIIKFDELDAAEELTTFNILLTCLLVPTIMYLFSNNLERIQKRNKIGKIIYSLKQPVSPMVFMIIMPIIFVLSLHTYITFRLSFAELVLVIIFSMITFNSISVYLSETGIAEQGIVEGDYVYLWDEILSHKYNETNNKLILNVKRRFLWSKINGKSELYYNKEDKSKIDQILLDNRHVF